MCYCMYRYCKEYIVCNVCAMIKDAPFFCSLSFRFLKLKVLKTIIEEKQQDLDQEFWRRSSPFYCGGAF